MVERWTRDAQGFVKWPDGEWVRYSDYERLRSELAACREALEKIEDVDFECYSISELHEYVTDLARAALSPSIQEAGE